MQILAIGDITEPRAVPFLQESLRAFRRQTPVDLVIANGENAGFIQGPTPDTARAILEAGVDCITGGNHTVQNKLLYPMLEQEPRLLRPLNYPAAVPGNGSVICRVGGYRVLVANVLGQVHMEPTLESPFTAVERLLEREAGHYDVAILDIHAEATGEKEALAYYFDGRFAAIFGTHTHVPTADEQILPGGTGYVTDIGMCGSTGGVIGVKKEVILERYLTRLPVRSEPAEGPLFATGILFTVESNRCTAVRRITFSACTESL